MRVVFIDGYNVINHWNELRDMKNYSYEIARQKLIEILNNYCSYTGDKINLIFDGHLIQGNIESHENHGKVSVVFTKEGETADSYIERSVNDIGRKIEVMVVTSDSLEQQVTFQRGATRTPSLEFYNEVNEIERKIKKETESHFPKTRNTVGDMIDKSTLEKLEKMRRSR